MPKYPHKPNVSFQACLALHFFINKISKIAYHLYMGDNISKNQNCSHTNGIGHL
jgi:hypothetical protein